MKIALFILGILAGIAIYAGPRYNQINNRFWTRIPPGYPADWTGPRYRHWHEGREV